MFKAQNRETLIVLIKSCCVLQDHYDNERYKIVFHKTPELQDQDQDRRSQTTSLQGSVSMRLRCDGIFNDQFITQSLLNPRVKFF